MRIWDCRQPYHKGHEPTAKPASFVRLTFLKSRADTHHNSDDVAHKKGDKNVLDVYDSHNRILSNVGGILAYIPPYVKPLLIRLKVLDCLAGGACGLKYGGLIALEATQPTLDILGMVVAGRVTDTKLIT